MDKIRKIIQSKLKEISSLGQGGASFTPGEGMNYATPNAFKGKKGKSKKLKPYFKAGYKMVPDTIDGSKLETIRLFEDELSPFQQERIAAFDDIETYLNKLGPIVSNAKNDTIKFYNENPGSYDIIKSTEMILSYLKNIETLLTETK